MLSKVTITRGVAQILDPVHQHTLWAPPKSIYSSIFVGPPHEGPVHCPPRPSPILQSVWDFPDSKSTASPPFTHYIAVIS